MLNSFVLAIPDLVKNGYSGVYKNHFATVSGPLKSRPLIEKINEKSRWTISMIDDSGRTICFFPLIFIYIVPRRIWLHICFSLKKSQITKCIAIQSFKGFKLNYGKIKMLQSNKDLLSQLG